MELFKKLIKIFLLIIILVVPVLAQQNSRKYEFPVKPGSAKWKTLKSHAKKLEVLQVPEDILSNISTEHLLQTCMNYPLYTNMIAFNNFQKGIEQIIIEFNGLQELLRRENGGTELLKEYLKKRSKRI